jgi:phage antirepressor YoqD-like protein
MNEIVVISQQEVLGKDFKVYGSIDGPLFLAKDVAEWIEYDLTHVSEMLNTIDEDEKIRQFGTLSNVANPVESTVGATNRWFLTENGLYEVLFQSRKPIAKQFKAEVKAILKALRKGEIAIQPQYYIPKTYPEALRLAADLQDENTRLEAENREQRQQIEQAAPMLEFYKAVGDSEELYLVRDVAHQLTQAGLPVGQNKLYAMLVDGKYLYMDERGYYHPYQRYQDRGYFRVIDVPVQTKNHGIMVKPTVKITGKGKEHLMGILLGRRKAG